MKETRFIPIDPDLLDRITEILPADLRLRSKEMEGSLCFWFPGVQLILYPYRKEDNAPTNLR